MSQPGVAELPLIYSDAPEAIAFWIAFVITFLPEWIGTFRQRSRAGWSRRDRGSWLVLVVCIWIALACGFNLVWLVPGATLRQGQLILVGAGIALMLLGTAFRWYAIRVLGPYFTRDVAVQPGQTLVQRGPYRYIRHPSYAGSIVALLGVGLALANWASLLAIILFVAIGYAYRIRVEETALREVFGPAYAEYARRTHRLIPFVF